MTEAVEGIPDNIKKHKKKVGKKIRELISGREDRLHEMVNYHLGLEGGEEEELKGKAIRPSLALFTAEALGGDPEDALPGAVSLELIHNFSLVHDDIQDDAETRRGRKSVQAKWGPAQAINAGDGIKDMSLLALTELGDGSRPGRTLRVLDALSNYSLRMIQGQVRDLTYAERKDVDVESYLEMIRDKTCALLQASFHVGAIYGEEAGDERSLVRLGKLLGYVYQIRDDWLGIWGQPEESGKSAQSDLIEKKMSYPVVYAVQKGEGSMLAELKRLYFRRNDLDSEEVEETKRILEELGAREGTNEKAREFWAEAERELKRTELRDWAKADLKNFGQFLLNRKK
ncbi:MAG: polyprenyl synthetase family protein [Candidatus Acetothermia bacterium]